MMKKKFTIRCSLFTLVMALALTSCDDGHVDDPVYNDSTKSYIVKISGTFQKRNAWSGSYSVAAAGFGSTDDYSLVQKVLPTNATDTSVETVILSKVPTKAETIEIAVVNRLRERIASLYSYKITEADKLKDTIEVNVGTINVGMFGAINKCVFQDMTCSRCHASAEATAHLDLTEANAYKSLINVKSYKNENFNRVKPNDADSSYLYRIITGTDEVQYKHSGLFSDTPDLIEIIKSWINSGAKE